MSNRYIQVNKGGRNAHLRLPILLGVALILLFGFGGYRLFSLLSEKKADSDDENIRIGVILSPQDISIKGDSLSGLQVELIKILPKMDRDYKIVPYTSHAESLEDLKNNRLDVLATSYLTMLDSSEDFIYTRPVYSTSYVLVRHIQDGDNISSFTLDSLRGKEITVSNGFPAMEVLISHLSQESIPDLQIRQTEESQEKLIRLVSEGTLAYVICEKSIAGSYAEKLPNLAIDTDVSFLLKHTWVLNAGQEELKANLDSVISLAYAKGTWTEVVQRYGMLPTL
ncbi:MAG: transporter substrate-binding domain-containing protein [Porphyromonas sp.]|nr:transporter substrate-binding domain-containing protein [Porphyromonas sp.]